MIPLKVSAPQTEKHLTAIKNTYLISISIYVIQRANAPARSIRTKGFIRGRKMLLSPGIIPHKLGKTTAVITLTKTADAHCCFTTPEQQGGPSHTAPQVGKGTSTSPIKQKGRMDQEDSHSSLRQTHPCAFLQV